MISDIDLNNFKERKVKARDIFYIYEVSKPTAYEFVKKYHYLGGAKFFSVLNYGLFYKKTNELVGVAVFACPQGISTLKGWFNLPNQDKSIMELTRLTMLPELNHTNATSYLLGNSLKLLKREMIRAVITLAQSDRHVGSIYQVCNFKYYGLTDKKTDFYTADGRVNPRGATKDIQGVWIPRARKHRYAYILDPELKCLYKEEPRPTKESVNHTECCNGTGMVLDKRFNVWYTCPRCIGHIEEVCPKF